MAQPPSLINEVFSAICRRQLSRSIDELENVLLTFSLSAYYERIQAIKEDYRLMTDYWQRGFADSQRDVIYRKLLYRMYELAADVQIQLRLDNSTLWRMLYDKPRKELSELSFSFFKNEMEKYVVEMALAELEPQHVRKTKTDSLNRQHQLLMENVFDYLLTSKSWNEGEAISCADIMLSPTIDANDQQLMISAITMSTLNTFDAFKVELLMRLYREASDKRIRQCALVGWALIVDDEKVALYPSIKNMVAEICGDKQACQELAELQIQLVFCMEAETIQKQIRDEIMPDIINSSRLKITNDGIREADENSLEDILHPDKAEKDMEKLEQSVKKMNDLQKQGFDIYFAGFSQMKRFPFFNVLPNWFMPFTPSHPSVSGIWDNAKGNKILHAITEISAFCDSDKYSFVLAFEQVLNHMPASMVEMVEHGEAVPMPIGGQVSEKEQDSAGFCRRSYLQSLYRFFKLYPMRNEFHNPFNHRCDYLFFSHHLFDGTPLVARKADMAAFFMKRFRNEDAMCILDNCNNEAKTYQYYMIRGTLLQRQKDVDLQKVESCYREALRLKPSDGKALLALGRVLFQQSQFEQALQIFEKLLAEDPESKNYQLNAAICRINLNRHEEAREVLFKLNYLYPDDLSVVRALAWVLTLCGSYEQAEKQYLRLMSHESIQNEDIQNYGYCMWFKGDIQSAVALLKRLVTNKDSHKQMEKTLCETDCELLRQHNISDAEIFMMLDELR